MKKKKLPLLILLGVVYVWISCSSAGAQQPFLNNLQFDCSSNGSSTLGYACNGAHASCSTYLTFRSDSGTGYQSPALISYLLNTNASAVAALNRVPDTAPVPSGRLLLVPATCSCSGAGFYQHNASYTIKYQGETYFLVANDTYQGLSTCQALIAQNPYDPRNLTVGMDLLVPLRCACPTANQTALGVKYLLNYLITPGDTVDAISARFGADYQSVLRANQITPDTVIFPYNSLLLPIKTEPTLADIATPAPPPAAPSSPPPPPPPGGSSNNNKKSAGLFVGIGIGAAAVILFFSGLLSWYFCCFKKQKKQRRRRRSADDAEARKMEEPKGGESPFKSGEEIRTFLDSLTVYKFADLEKATDRFAEEKRIRGSVYRGAFNGDDAAVKRLKGDVSGEVNILKHINHSSVVRLSGLCVHEGNTYLVYEFVERGSLADWLHRDKDQRAGPALSWRQRVRIAYDVADGLNYLHHYTSPPYVHKNVKSSNVLLDTEFRAKLANFGLARAVEERHSGLQLTRHVVGTQGYMAPEYLEHGLVTPKLDVFAFGVVVFELLSGKEAVYPKDTEEEEKGELLLSASFNKLLSGEDARTKLRDLLDPCLGNDYPIDTAFAMAELAVRCVAREPGSRPSMTDVLVTLSALYNSTLDWDPSEVRNQDSTVHGR